MASLLIYSRKLINAWRPNGWRKIGDRGDVEGLVPEDGCDDTARLMDRPPSIFQEGRQTGRKEGANAGSRGPKSRREGGRDGAAAGASQGPAAATAIAKTCKRART
ncbi:hypothetical protein MMC07_002737 [Pseudocyphellaria aurata]|nr:hypothetical protein [Pseudocyphellaria aurata]